MPPFLVQIITWAMSIVSAAALLFTPLTEAAVRENFEKAVSFAQVQYEDQLVPEKDEDGYWTFTTDDEFKVVQLTDVHIGGGIMSKDKDLKAMNAVAAMLHAEKPDLVVITGDMAYPVPFQVGTFNNSISTRMLISLLETLGVYYTVGFGNHDGEAYSTHTREQIADLWGDESLKYSLFQKGPSELSGFGNHVIKVKNTDGIVTDAFFMFDSHDYTDNDPMGIFGFYANIQNDQIKWYKENVLAIDAANKALDSSYPMFNSLAFFHIPLEEYETAWGEFRANGYKDTENVKYIDGWYNEGDEKVCKGIGTDSLFETMLELGSTKAVFCGHDHINNAILEYKGIKLVYGMSIDYVAYIDPVLDNLGSQRGCTVITLDREGNTSVTLENYYQDKYPSQYEKEEVTMQWAD